MQHKKIGEKFRRFLGEAFKCQDAAESDTLELYDDDALCSDPAQYAWRYAGTQEMLVPSNCIVMHSGAPGEAGSCASLNTQPIRWANHQVLIVEGMLRRGESNILPRRVFYIDAQSHLVVLGEAYDIGGAMQKIYLLDTYLSGQPRPLGRWYHL